MNPQTSALPAAPRMVNDVAGHASPPQPAAAPTHPPVEQPAPITAGPSIVANIPVHTPQAAAPANEDEELDKIMHDVGQELKKEENNHHKHGLLDFLHHEPKPLVKVNNQAPKPQAAQSAMPAAPLPVGPAVDMPAAAVVPQALPQTQPKPANQQQAGRHVPVFVIFMTLCVTVFLVAAAIAAYRQS